MSSTQENFVFPGQRVAECDSNTKFVKGEGVFEKDGALFASISGIVACSPSNVISIQRSSTSKKAFSQVLPSIGQTVLGRIVKLTTKYAGVDIMAVEGHLSLMESIKGTIRTQDIVDIEEKDVPLIHMAFRPGDIVRARVIGVGDPSAGFLLSTGMTADLGVVFGKSATAGAPLIPYAWNEMICSKTGIKEKRKCAKPNNISK